MREKVPYRAGVTFRPSMITYNFCRRLKIGQLAGLIDIYDKPAKPRLQTVFDVGNAIHEIVQTYFWDIGQLKGTYKCIKCDKLYYDLVSPTTCPSGKKTHKRSHLKYKEIKLTNDEYKISGRADGIVVIDGEDHLMDIKSIANRSPTSSDRQTCFEDVKLHGPKEEHVIQLCLYMFLTGLRNAHLLYFAKNTGQIITFAIPYDYGLIEPFLREIKHLLDCAERLKAGTLDKLPLPCGDEECLCHTILIKRAN